MPGVPQCRQSTIIGQQIAVYIATIIISFGKVKMQRAKFPTNLYTMIVYVISLSVRRLNVPIVNNYRESDCCGNCSNRRVQLQGYDSYCILTKMSIMAHMVCNDYKEREEKCEKEDDNG